MEIKTLGSEQKIRVGRVTGNRHFFFGLNIFLRMALLNSYMFVIKKITKSFGKTSCWCEASLLLKYMYNYKEL